MSVLCYLTMDPLKITLDTNCVIDLELNQGAAPELRGIIAFHEVGSIVLRVPAIGASERMKGGSYASTFSVFQERVHKLSSKEIEILRPILYWGIGYWGWSLWSSKEMSQLEAEIHKIMFPGSQFDWNDYARTHGINPERDKVDQTKEWKTWRNRKCDTLSMWCHIHYNGDIFVTRDSHFFKADRRKALIEIGAKNILEPHSALEMIRTAK